ncbi:N-(5'-phosphoribosyl)anthranilate isomerase [Paenibacillus sp. 598K]|uniref:phosphoribosylanthranilate isomerase n=1 Tax=Paenibacillus sp. 598K TaxID=1117987 RepID=UPI000FF93F1B|nr:phosphoribosylanthranilate isomerase [Paenibacillus sp. 598K]GBF72778.1 N-(5'-phosphoribosyl)anthranilate isomerase [Paenibacillus sp. 598K]
MSVRVKICGLRDAETIRAMDGLAVDEIGFVFAKSRRQVSPMQAEALIDAVAGLRNHRGEAPRTVGVFVDPTLEQLEETLATASLDVIQLHGEETPQLCRDVRDRLGRDVWKVLSVGELHEDAVVRLAPYAGAIDAVLIDTAGGGTGQTFQWDRIPAYAAAAQELGLPLYVAGGLHPGNVEELLRSYAPRGIDVSSGVETDGVKDIGLIKQFIERVKEA